MVVEETHLNVGFVNVIWEPWKTQTSIVIVSEWETMPINSIVCLVMALGVVAVENAFAMKIVSESNVNAILYSVVS